MTFALARRWAETSRQPLHEIPLFHSGGNFQVSAVGDAHATRLVNQLNPSLNETRIGERWSDYLEVQTTFHPMGGWDGTDHLDVWMQIFGDREVMIAEWPNPRGTQPERVADEAAANLGDRGYAVHRAPAWSTPLLQCYSYVNVILCNNLILVPTFSRPGLETLNPRAVAAWEGARPRATVVTIEADALVAGSGGLHCLSLPVPKPRNGSHPAVHLRTCRGGETLRPGETNRIGWISDGVAPVRLVDLHLSEDGGVTFGTPITSGLADTGSFDGVVLCRPDTVAQLFGGHATPASSLGNCFGSAG